jgi:DNA-binding response OmpR family regulator
MVLSDRDGVKNRVDAFKSGVDDYVTKPFNPMELRARVEMVLRRTQV